MRNKKGFTLIELLVVIAIIGLLATLSVVALNNARQKSRDAKRVSDIKQIQTALELYFVDQNSYPTAPTQTALGDTSGPTDDSVCLDSDGWEDTAGCAATIYMGQVPDAPTPAATPDDYVYARPTADTYTITFGLEGATGGLASGSHIASPNGIQ